MKRINAIALLAIANFAMAGTSFAQYNEVRANVPFDFTVGDKQSAHVILIRNRDKPIAAVSLVNGDGNKSPDGGKLKFHRYGSQYFLSEILCDRADMNLQLPQSKTEKGTALREAKLNTRDETFVAAR
jgi:hypothetical protein